MKRTASAQWQGGLKDGKGTLSSDSQTLNKTSYAFHDRFGEGKGTNPEELIAAAHAGCFSMAFAGQLEKEGLKPEFIKTSAQVTLEKEEGGFTIPSIHLTVSAKIPNASKEQFDKAARNAKEGCPVSKLFNAEITMNATLEE